MPKTLKIDMDWKPPEDFLEQYIRMVVIVVKHFSKAVVVDWEKRISQNGGLHLYFELNNILPSMDILRLQFLLGDDRTRCRLNLGRIEAGIPDWNVLFARKVKFNNSEKKVE